MTETSTQRTFTRLRNRLATVYRKDRINDFFSKPHPKLNGQSPARAIHSGKTADVETLVDTIINGHR